MDAVSHISNRPASRRRRWVRIIVLVLVALLALPFIFLHLLSFLFSRHDQNMMPYGSRMVSDGLGHQLRVYELKQPDAEWNIIYIHGTPASGAAFVEQFRHPFPHANLLSYDRPGFGKSTPASAVPTLEAQAEIVGALLSNTNHLPTILVGHSYGGPIALLSALKFPDRVAGILLIGGSVDPDQEHVLTIQKIGAFPPISWLLPQALRQCNRELIPLRGQLDVMHAQLASLSVPVMMLHGGKDPLVPVANVGWLRAQLQADGKGNLFDAMVISNYNHFIPWEHPDAVTAALTRLTNRLKSSLPPPMATNEKRNL